MFFDKNTRCKVSKFKTLIYSKIVFFNQNICFDRKSFQKFINTLYSLNSIYPNFSRNTRYVEILEFELSSLTVLNLLASIKSYANCIANIDQPGNRLRNISSK